MTRKLPRSFYTRPNVVSIARELLGKQILTRLGGKTLTGGIIVETEAYAGPVDRASHAYKNKRTDRTEIMFHRGGVAYVYLCYGMHHLFNIVTNTEDIPHAVLVRAIEPTEGIKTILKRRGKSRLDRTIAGGPGSLSQALGITTRHSGISLTGNRIWLEDRGLKVPPKQVETGPRVGVDYAGPDARRPWRFKIRNNHWTSKA